MITKYSSATVIALAVSMTAPYGVKAYAAEPMDHSTMGHAAMGHDSMPTMDHSKMGSMPEGPETGIMDHSQMTVSYTHLTLPTIYSV